MEAPNYLLSFLVVGANSYHGVLFDPPRHNFPYGVVLNWTFFFKKNGLWLRD